jgi:hypothetical protein
LAADRHRRVGDRDLGRRTGGAVVKKLAPTYRALLENVAEGKQLFDGYEGSSLGGAVRAFHFWREGNRLIVVDGDNLKLTDAGRKALETGEY